MYVRSRWASLVAHAYGWRHKAHEIVCLCFLTAAICSRSPISERSILTIIKPIHLPAVLLMMGPAICALEHWGRRLTCPNHPETSFRLHTDPWSRPAFEIVGSQHLAGHKFRGHTLVRSNWAVIRAWPYQRCVSAYRLWVFSLFAASSDLTAANDSPAQVAFERQLLCRLSMQKLGAIELVSLTPNAFQPNGHMTRAPIHLLQLTVPMPQLLLYIYVVPSTISKAVRKLSCARVHRVTHRLAANECVNISLADIDFSWLSFDMPPQARLHPGWTECLLKV